MRNIKITIEYDGTNYFGWQTQEDKPTIQEHIENAILKATGEKPSLIGASRTDAGVHAAGQVANFRTSTRISAARLPHAINFYLPEDISILNAQDVPLEFHAQFQAKEKTYEYTIVNSFIARPLQARYGTLVRSRLDAARMKKAAAHFVGTHDFKAFGAETHKKKTTVRTINSITVLKRGTLIRIRVSGNGFLYNMVRCMAGTIVKAGKRKVEPEEVRDILARRDRIRAGPVMPPNGLCLIKVKY